MYKDKITEFLNLTGNPVTLNKDLLLRSLCIGSGNFGKRTNKLYSLKLSALSIIKYNKSLGVQEKKAGFLYAITNPAWPNLVKLGMSTQPLKRLAQYQTYSPFRDYRLHHWSLWLDVRSVEKKVHKLLGADHEWVVLTEDLQNLFSDLNNDSSKQFLVP